MDKDKATKYKCINMLKAFSENVSIPFKHPMSILNNRFLTHNLISADLFISCTPLRL